MESERKPLQLDEQTRGEIMSPQIATLRFDLSDPEGEERLKDAINGERYRVAIQEIDSQLYYITRNCEDPKKALVANDLRRLVHGLIEHYGLFINWEAHIRH